MGFRGQRYKVDGIPFLVTYMSQETGKKYAFCPNKEVDSTETTVRNNMGLRS